mgnify:CR=1 FL=1
MITKQFLLVNIFGGIREKTMQTRADNKYVFIFKEAHFTCYTYIKDISMDEVSDVLAGHIRIKCICKYYIQP